MVASANTLDGSPFHWIERIHKNHAARMGNGFTMVVVFVGCEMWLT
jgi:predicted transcriptional regulator